MKINCFVLCYHDFPTMETTLNCLMREPSLEINVIENPSENTEAQFKPYLLDLLKKKKIHQYFLFDKNITNNATHVAIQSGDIPYDGDYFMLTDGDVKVDPGWLEEELNILQKCPEVFVVAAGIDMSNLPLKNFPEAHGWVPPNTREAELYNEGAGACHLMLMKMEDFLDYLDFQKTSGMKWTDTTIHHFAYVHQHRIMAKTKNHLVRHLAWDLYADLNHPYTESKMKKSILQLWEHDEVCDYQLFKQEA